MIEDRTSGWKPIEDLPTDWSELIEDDLHALARVWQEQKDRLQESKVYQTFLERMRRRIAIETGVIERLYTIDRGTTRLLIERGIDESLISHDATDRPSSEVIALIRDQEQAIDGLFNFVGRQRSLSNSYIKQLHQLLTRHQPFTEAVDQFGNLGRVSLTSGDWKKFPNNPTRPDGQIYYYCPPEQVASQMDQLIEWHQQHEAANIAPEVEAAWLHHRFTQIHPFQDGNGRVARCLASLVFIRAEWFPLVITRDDRTEYIEALEAADQGNLRPLVELFVRAQRQEFVTSLGLSQQALSEAKTVDSAIAAIAERIKLSQTQKSAEQRSKVEGFAEHLAMVARQRFEQVEQEIRVALHTLGTNAEVFVRYAGPTDPTSHYFRYQIIETARALEYYANLRDYKSWLRLSIRYEDTQTDVLLSYHVLGRDYNGLMVCSACGFRRVSSEDNQSTTIADLQPLSQTPFQFSYVDTSDKLDQRFKLWLENVLIVGLEYWRRGLGF